MTRRGRPTELQDAIAQRLEEGPRSVAELAEDLGRRPSSIGRAVSALWDRGLITVDELAGVEVWRLRELVNSARDA